MSKGRPIKRIFRLYDIETGELFMEGSSKELGEALGVGKWAINQAFEKNMYPTYKGYSIEAVCSEVAKSDAEAIANWNAFVEPLREKFGIPVYRPKRTEGSKCGHRALKC